MLFSTLKHEIIKFEIDSTKNEIVASILKVDTIVGRVSCEWEIVDTSFDGIASILITKIFEDNVAANSERSPEDVIGIYCAIFKDRFSIMNGKYTLTKIGEV